MRGEKRKKRKSERSGKIKEVAGKFVISASDCVGERKGVMN